MSEPKDNTTATESSSRCSSADPCDPHLNLAACFIHRVFADYGHTWGGKLPSTSEIAEFVAKQVDLMRQGNMDRRSLGGIMFARDPLTNIVEIGASITHHFPEVRNMVLEDGIPMVKWGYGDCPFCNERDELFWVDGDRDTLQCGTCLDG